MIFHAFPSVLRGGFIGVDIFFVISGFLISSIIIGNLGNNSFSFLDFYGRRIRRIFPVLLLVLAASYAAGWFMLLPDEFKQFGLHMSSGAGFAANFTFWSESGYFDTSAELKPLLHLWSLGVEEQFYIIWPALLWCAWRKSLNLFSITILVGLLSLALNIATIGSDQPAAFYSPQTRFWEMLAGSALAYLTLRRQVLFHRGRQRLDAWLGGIVYANPPAANGKTLSDLQSLAGIGLIAAGFWMITPDRAFPGWWALFPTAGALLIISAGPHAWLNRSILASKPLVWVGLISFPLYLWHWPLLVFARVAERDTPSPSIRLAALAATFVLAWLSYVVVEQRIRSGRHSRSKTLVLVMLMLTAGTIGYATYRHDGYASRMQDRAEFAAYFENSLPGWQYFNRIGIPQKVHHECEFFDIEQYRAGNNTIVPRKEIAAHCYQRDLAKAHSVLLWGDSHAEHLSFGLRNALPKDWQVLQVASSSCIPYLNAEGPSTTDQCTQTNWLAQKVIMESKPDVVIIAQHAGHTNERFQQFAAALKNFGVKKIIYTGPVPHWTDELPNLILTKLWLNTPRRTYRGIDKSILDTNAALLAGFKQTDSEIYVDLIDFFCDKDGCLTYLGDDRKTGITSYDRSHLTPAASDFLAKNLLAKTVTSGISP